MYKEEIVKHFTILCTSNGYMIEHEDDDGGYEYIHAPNGDNTFDTYAQATVVLAHYLLGVVL
jgi:hypothetical protein